jgi:hypothetical protein
VEQADSLRDARSRRRQAAPPRGLLRNVTVARGGEISATAVSDEAGFRIDLVGSCGTYEIALRTSWQGSALEHRGRRRLCPGDSLPLDAPVVTQGHYLCVPGPR